MRRLKIFIPEKDATADFNSERTLFIMLKRVLTSVVGVAILLPILIFSNTYVLPVAIAIVTFIGLYEMFNCVGIKKKLAMTIPAYMAAVTLPILAKYYRNINGGIIAAIMILYALYLLAVAVFGHKSHSIIDAAMAFMTAIYIVGGFLSIQLLREQSSSIYLLVFIGAWVTDIFAYFSGRFFGKHKLCEAVSPKKTVEGSIGGIIFCSISFVIFALFVKGTNLHFSRYLIWAGVGIVISIVSQIGDLSMSLIKRHFGIKDFGKLFPGHGGILDRFDSVIAVSFVLYIIISLLNILNINII